MLNLELPHSKSFFLMEDIIIYAFINKIFVSIYNDSTRYIYFKKQKQWMAL